MAAKNRTGTSTEIYRTWCELDGAVEETIKWCEQQYRYVNEYPEACGNFFTLNQKGTELIKAYLNKIERLIRMGKKDA